MYSEERHALAGSETAQFVMAERARAKNALAANTQGNP
jgi:hypothetical protein